MKVFYALVALICVFLLFDSARVSYAKYKAGHVDEAYIQEAQDADLEVIAFIDYNCPSCRQFYAVLKRAIEKDGRIRYISKPIIPATSSGISFTAPVLAIAAGRQGKFFEAQDMLIENYRNIDEAYISAFAKDLALDEAQLRDDLDDPDILKNLTDNIKTLQNMKAKHVPALLLNGQLLYEVKDIPNSETVQNVFNAARGL